MNTFSQYFVLLYPRTFLYTLNGFYKPHVKRFKTQKKQKEVQELYLPCLKISCYSYLTFHGPDPYLTL